MNCAAGKILVREKLDALRTELSDLAYALESRGRCDAADVTMAICARIAEIGAELAASGTAGEFALEAEPEGK